MDIRPSPIAGTWYPSQSKTLAQLVDQHLAVAAAEGSAPPGRPRAVLAPHAGLRYSGPVAGYSFNCLRGLNPKIVAVIGPMHHLHTAPLLTSGHEAYETPLGPVKVDREALDHVHHSLKDTLGYGLTRVREDPEHSVEIELPFLQRIFGDFLLLPIMIVNQHLNVAEALGKALAEALRERDCVLVASSDLSHFYPQDVAQTLDGEVLRRLERFDPEGVVSAQDEGVGYACGRGAIAAVLWAARALGASRVNILRYATSGDVSADYTSVVGYAAAAVSEAA
ncbi:MAG: AmmeMemoRadiSam system protein B [Verrucomicrobia bacterium]|nr:AmmeMemoRadiSam system protein B [Verrucomicrobiota bacterium]